MAVRPSDAALFAPEQASAERDDLEELALVQFDRAMAEFLVGVSGAALAALETTALGDRVLLAAPQVPFTRAAVRRIWDQAVGRIATPLSELFGFTPRPGRSREDEARRWSSELSDSQVVEWAYGSVSSMSASASTNQSTRGSLGDALLGLLSFEVEGDPPELRKFAKAAGIDLHRPDWKAAARRQARTTSTEAYASATLRRLAQQGYTHKRWQAFKDDAVRPSHDQADGQRQALNDNFNVGGHSMMYPGDRSAPGEERYNCRCVVVGASS